MAIRKKAGLMPPGPIAFPEEVDSLIKSLDSSIRSTRPELGNGQASHTAPYVLRRAALDEELQPYEIGRAFYHLAQRRGFLSNRKTDRKDKEAGKVKEGIGHLYEQMKAAGARTLGEYFASLDPTQERIRKRWTARQMYLDEFDAIWNKQKEFYAELLNDAAS